MCPQGLKPNMGITACAGRFVRGHGRRLLSFISSSDGPVLMGTDRSVFEVKSDLVRNCYAVSLRVAD
jgi:hypothetical protein